MAKATSKNKPSETKVEQPKEEMVQIGQTSGNPTDEMKLVEIPKIEAIEMGFVKEDGVKEIDMGEGKKVWLVDENVTVKQGGAFMANYIPDIPELSMEDKILNFIDSRPDGEIKMNDFLKSLYPLPKFNEPAVYLQQAKAKELKGVLAKLESDGKVSFVGNGHTKLGKFYYEGNDTVTKYHNILTTQIVVKK